MLKTKIVQVTHEDLEKVLRGAQLKIQAGEMRIVVEVAPEEIEEFIFDHDE